jgi:hypothetical protein
VSEPNEKAPPAEHDLAVEQKLAGLSVDWWATIVAGVFVVLAVANVLPKIPW